MDDLGSNGYPVEIGRVDDDAFDFIVDHDGAVGEIRRGSVVRLQRCDRITGDGVYLVKISGCVMLRRVQVLPGWRYRVFCDEERYEPITISAGDKGGFRVLGRGLHLH